MNAFLICSILLLISSDFVIGQEKLHVGVYYESLCPDSILFIENQLLPNYKHFGDLIDIDFVPFGKSSSLVRADGIEFTCQHGRYECEGNRIQSCALTAASNRDSQMVFVACQMSRYAEPSGQMCTQQAGIPFDIVSDCAYGVDGENLQLIAEKKTQAIAHPNPMLNFVPTIVYNHNFDQAKQNRSLRDFRSVVCEELRTISNNNNLPQICLI